MSYGQGLLHINMLSNLPSGQMSWLSLWIFLLVYDFVWCSSGWSFSSFPLAADVCVFVLYLGLCIFPSTLVWEKLLFCMMFGLNMIFFVSYFPAGWFNMNIGL